MQTKPTQTTNPRAHKNALKLKTAQNYVEERERIELSLGGQICRDLSPVFQPYMVLFFNRIMEKTRDDVFEMIELASFPDSDNINPDKWDRDCIEGAAQGMLEIKIFSDFYLLSQSAVDKFHRRRDEISRNEEKCNELMKEHYLNLASYARVLEQKVHDLDNIHLELTMLWKWQLEKYPQEMEDINECYYLLCRLLMLINRYFDTGNDIEDATKGGVHA